jgi:hypothetical protein
MLAVLNIINWGNPGFYEIYGFPMLYYKWSDQIVPGNYGMRPLGVVVDVVVCMAVLVLLRPTTRSQRVA